jgi:hypothetical protein
MTSTLADLNPLDFYLWRYLQSLMYSAPADNKEALHHRVMVACQTNSNYPAIYEWMQRSMTRRVEACIEYHGGRFEHLLIDVLFQL